MATRLAAHPRFHMHFTPTYSSWLNRIERWFAVLTDKQLRRSVHGSVCALEKDIRDWITNWNNDPRPFVWTKTADDIFERLTSYLHRIPGAGHYVSVFRLYGADSACRGTEGLQFDQRCGRRLPTDPPIVSIAAQLPSNGQSHQVDDEPVGCSARDRVDDLGRA
jgi:hypothetical protein